MDKELSRVLSNPENVIMSDSLKDILDLDSEPEREIDSETCTIEFKDNIITGQVRKLSWSEPDSYLKINFACDQSIFKEFLSMKGEKISVSVFNFTYSGKLSKLSLEKSLNTEVEITIDQ